MPGIIAAVAAALATKNPCWAKSATALTLVALTTVTGIALADARDLPIGLWGGEHLRLLVTRSGGELEFDCAAGVIEEPIVLNDRGRFEARGSYTPEHGGPGHDGRPASVRARYAGAVVSDTMKLTVTDERSRTLIGTFQLKRGADTLLAKCR